MRNGRACAKYKKGIKNGPDSSDRSWLHALRDANRRRLIRRESCSFKVTEGIEKPKYSNKLWYTFLINHSHVSFALKRKQRFVLRRSLSKKLLGQKF